MSFQLKAEQTKPKKVWQRQWETKEAENVTAPPIEEDNTAYGMPNTEETLSELTGQDEDSDGSQSQGNEHESRDSNKSQGQKPVDKGLAFSLQLPSSQTSLSNPQCANTSENNEANELLRSGKSKRSEFSQIPGTSYADMTSYSQTLKKDLNEQRNHMQTHPCDLSKKSFRKKSASKKYQKDLKTKNIFPCSVCQKQFTRNNLKAHEQIHSGEKPHECDTCKRTFYQASALKRHKKFHSDERPYECDMCHKTFKEQGILKRHKQIHAEGRSYTCKVCGQNFELSEDLRIHKRIHVEEIPYFCESCGNNFKNPSRLESHKRIHLDERPYQCDLCHKTFKHSGSFKKHKQIHAERNFSRVTCVAKAFNY